MTSQAAVHTRNLESSILFMQQEHADTLKCLHVEISKLQKKCTDLTFQLTMNGLSIDDSEDTNDKFKELKKSLEEQKVFIKVKEEQLSERDEKIKELEQLVKVYKKKYLDESRKQTETVNKLKADIETKSCTVAYLTSKLHQLKSQTHLEPKPEGTRVDLGKIDMGRLPTPPKEAMSKPRRAANLKRNPNTILPEPVKLQPVRLSSGRSSGSNRSDSPDISQFLPHTKSEQYGQDVKVRAKPTILPPINASHDNTSVLLHQVVRPKHKSAAPEITTLAVEQLPHKSKNWMNPQESHSSEYK